ncbi:putative permease, DMT superfamily [Sesbania bispinosa]|nr:putative permease, DMT superfamily [Sesbania bispinosa]
MGHNSALMAAPCNSSPTDHCPFPHRPPSLSPATHGVVALMAAPPTRSSFFFQALCFMFGCFLITKFPPFFTLGGLLPRPETTWVLSSFLVAIPRRARGSRGRGGDGEEGGS